MHTVAIVQARLGSTRLPGKALLQIAGQTMLACTVKRALQARTLDAVAVATTNDPRDDPIAVETGSLGIACVRGAEHDVLSRYLQAARELNADVVVRLTSDCPLIDPGVIDLVVAAFRSANPSVDYASNTQVRTYPRGLDVEVFSRDALERTAEKATLPHEREHVTPYIYQHPEAFRLLSIENQVDCSSGRWTVDTQEDLDLVREIYRRFRSDELLDWQSAWGLVVRDKELSAINRNVQQKSFAPS
jgi:spore coat polysaccharide biosynthesis protein SpsF